MTVSPDSCIETQDLWHQDAVRTDQGYMEPWLLISMIGELITLVDHIYEVKM